MKEELLLDELDALLLDGSKKRCEWTNDLKETQTCYAGIIEF